MGVLRSPHNFSLLGANYDVKTLAAYFQKTGKNKTEEETPEEEGGGIDGGYLPGCLQL